MSQLNSENRKKQKWRHRMGPINFARVRVALRATKENNEEPSSLKYLLQPVQRMGRKFIQILKLQYLNFKIIKVMEKHKMMHLGLYLERSNLVGLDAMIDRSR
nr:uncharacterized protein LOC108946131 [Nicotiana tomentosiformis]